MVKLEEYTEFQINMALFKHEYASRLGEYIFDEDPDPNRPGVVIYWSVDDAPWEYAAYNYRAQYRNNAEEFCSKMSAVVKFSGPSVSLHFVHDGDYYSQSGRDLQHAAILAFMAINNITGDV